MEISLTKIASAQYPIDQPSTLVDWENKITDWVTKGAATGSRLLVFPEYAAIEQAACFGPEIFSDLKRTLDKVSELAALRMKVHLSLARKLNIHILVGSGPVKKSDGRYVNVAQLITPKGKIGEQEKLIMTPFEKEWGMSSGNPPRVFKTELGEIGILICYDSEFPLLARAMAEAGADLLLVPSCTEQISGFNRVRTACLARALENTIAVVQSPTVGDALWSPAVDRNQGSAGIYVPSEHSFSDTGVIAEGQINKAEWIIATLDLNRLKELRKNGEMRNYIDWSFQPGATALKSNIEKVSLL